MNPSDMYYWDEIPIIKPAVQPRYWPPLIGKAPSFEVYTSSRANPMRSTTLDTWFAPDAPMNSSTYTSSRTPGTGVVVAGNAPVMGIYTGIQQE